MYKRIKPDLQRYRYHYKQLIIERNTNENVYMYHYSIYLALKSRLSVVAKDEIESDISSMHGMILQEISWLNLIYKKALGKPKAFVILFKIIY